MINKAMGVGLSGQAGYRPDIDGLRAVAVIAVVGYHVGVPGFSGGFVGVDVFFVISGFLISQLLIGENARTGRIDIADFYARRVRRLIPALGVVLAATLLLGFFFLTPVDERQGLAKSAIAAAGFVANLWFWRGQTGYFADSVDAQPLLHTWTLSVEEQFYLVWPLLIILAMRGAKGRGRLAAVLIAGGVLAFLADSILAYWRPTAAFFFTPLRAWEFGVGALLALYPLAGRLKRPAADLVGLAGLAAIVGTVVVLNRDSIFPGWRALPVVLGSAAVIGAAASRNSPAGWFLSSPPAVGLGKLSYSWYLWHWPLLVFARLDGLGRSLPRDLALAALALGLAALTYRFVEQPVRLRRPGPFATRSGSLWAGAAILAACIALSGALWSSADLALKASPELGRIRLAKADYASLPSACTNVRPPFGRMPQPSLCFVGDKAAAKTLLLLGDSHAAQLIPALDSLGAAQHVRVLVRSQSGCAPYLEHPLSAGARPTALEVACPAYNRMVWAELPTLRALGVTRALLVSRWNNNPPHEASLLRLVERLHAQGLSVVLAADTPPLKMDAPTCLPRGGEAGCGLTRAQVDARRAGRLAALRRVAGAVPGVTVWDPLDALCNATACPLTAGGEMLYRDDNHVSLAGSRRLIPSLAPVLAPLAPP